jgi:hypothetical protein
LLGNKQEQRLNITPLTYRSRLSDHLSGNILLREFDKFAHLSNWRGLNISSSADCLRSAPVCNVACERKSYKENTKPWVGQAMNLTDAAAFIEGLPKHDSSRDVGAAFANWISPWGYLAVSCGESRETPVGRTWEFFFNTWPIEWLL